MEPSFVKIDLHIHTPASKDYRGRKNDRDEYLSIVRQAKQAGLQVIALTDHNSLAGYWTLMEIKSSLMSQRSALSTITDSRQSKAKLTKVEEELALFEKILILPGIELEVRNGIHVLVVFSDSVSRDILDKFLIDGGFTKDQMGEASPTKLCKWDIIDLFEVTEKLDCLVIDAHTDSDKGMFKTLPAGTLRADCFRSPRLNAVCYGNEGQMAKLRAMLETAREYKRPAPLAFVRFSDAHRVEEVGSCFTWVKLDRVEFSCIRSAFSNPSEFVSVEEPSLSKILVELLGKKNSFGIPDLSGTNNVLFERYLCALANSFDGFILLGVSENKRLAAIDIGKNPNKERVDGLVDEMTKHIRMIEVSLRLRATIYPLSGNRLVISVHVRKGSTLASIKGDGAIYAIKDAKLATLSGAEIEELIEDRVVDEIGTRIGKRIAEVEADCRLIKNLFSTMPLLREFERRSVPFTFEAKIRESLRMSEEDAGKMKKLNGVSIGNVSFLADVPQLPRFAYAYLRYSLPVFTKLPGILYRTIHRQPGSSYGLKFLTCFLKSSLLLWYCMNRFNNADIAADAVFYRLRLPRPKTSDDRQLELIARVEGHFDEIVKHERSYLASVQKIGSNEEKLKELTDAHNEKAAGVAHQIDLLIYDLFGLNAPKVSVIEDYLRLNDIFLPPRPNCEEESPAMSVTLS